MKEIKFRVWDVFGKNMRKVSKVCFGDDGSALTISVEPEKHARLFESFVDGESGILMQFTGLADKNGKEIYEGDIVKDDNSTFKVEWEFAKWHFQRINGAYQYPSEYSTASRMEIIGNIYENPELLTA